MEGVIKDEMEERKRYKMEATRAFNSILLEDPSHFLSLYGKALLCWKEERYDECFKTMDQAMMVQPINSPIHIDVMKGKMLKLLNMKKVKLEDMKEGNAYGRVYINQNPIAGYKVGQFVVRDAESERVHHCRIRDKYFTKAFSLNRHMFLHNGMRPHKCSQCRKGFIQKTDMERHETTHSDVLNFHCEHCQKRFKTKKNLNCHLITHSTDRPFNCKYCDKSFKVKRLLMFHEGLHKPEKPFNCDICGKGFPAKPYIKSHLKTHIDDKPFVCKFCSFAFKRNYDLNFHIRHQHKNHFEGAKAK